MGLRRVAQEIISKAEDVETPNGISLKINGLSKVFPGTRALDNVDLEIRHGEVLGLCGGNGSGKSTLIKILSGVYEADKGEITVGGAVIDARQMQPNLAHDLGVRVVHQDLALFSDMTVAENMMIGSVYPVTRMGRIHWREVRERTRRQAVRFEIPVKPGDKLQDLPVAIRTQVAIARALRDADPARGVIVFDEPTAALPMHEVQLLHDAIRSLAAKGHAVLLVSHRLDEVLELTDRVTILRDGRCVADHRTDQLTEAELVEAILGDADVGRDGQLTHHVGLDSEVVLSVSGLNAGPVRDVNLELRAGEVVGVAGLLGSGRTELLHALWGGLMCESGTVQLEGRPVRFKRMGDAIAAGVIYIPEDRAAAGIFADMVVDENLDIAVLRKYWRFLGFRGSRMRRDADHLIKRFRVRTPNGQVPMRALSGGNQQKVIMARWLRRKPRLLLLNEPSQGVDVGARTDIYAVIREMTQQGSAALVVSSDMEELAQVVDRAVVMRQGRVVAHVPYEELSAQRLTELLYMEGENHD